MIVEFKKELSSLLKKHGAAIEFSWSHDSDSGAVFNERIEVEFNNLGEPETHILSQGFFVTYLDLLGE